MNAASQHRRRVVAAWLLALLAGLVIIATRLGFSYDLGLFLPRAEGLDQRVLVARAGDTPGARFLLLALPPGVDVPAGVVARLSAHSDIARLPGQGNTDSRPPEPAWRYRYLLTDTDWSTEGLAATLRDRLAELGLAPDPTYEALLRHDPTLASFDALSGLDVTVSGAAAGLTGRQVLVIETVAAPFDLDGQAGAIAAVRDALAAEGLDPGAAEISGAGVFGVELRDTIRAEATWRSLAASIALVLVIGLAYRRFSVLWLAAVPLATGMVAGLAALTLAFEQVHGITLAFGFTLLGIAIDFPLHYFSHRRHSPGGDAMRRVWPTLRLGAVSTALAYGALLLGGAEGMAQLGLFSAVGVIAAAATTRWVLPVLAGDAAGEPLDVVESGNAGSPGLVLPLVVLVAALIALAAMPFGLAGSVPFWNRDLSALSPVPEAQLRRDAALRQAVGAPSMRYQLALADSDPDQLARRRQALHEALVAAVRAEQLEGFRDLAPLLPPVSLQRERQNRIPSEAVLRERLRAATAELPFGESAFEPFIDDAMAAKDLAPVSAADYAGSPLAPLVDASLLRLAGPAGEVQWVSLVDLPGTVSRDVVDGIAERFDGEVFVVDYRQASESLVAGYQQRTWRVLGMVLVLIAALLCWRVRPARAAWSLACVAAALVSSALLLRLLTGPLDLYHMVGLLLVGGLGLDYALFLGRGGRDWADTRHAVATCAASTVVAFAVLAASGIPALRSLGTAVALGALLSYLVARLGSRRTQA
ncbi:hypothetical protein F3N42_08775 [Marinihelvus fidelis]|uniref:MMPL family transporter n=1 Tax=Marinihelvus fidelis TaxID=2613842 RepID=A0A5N0TAF5_9GAMM|nr:hypothetical protein [Marinihelvus fidelis]KAA9131404.1 hypothetical protein F3N42_08775 [Marinihelvus fidelis]